MFQWFIRIITLHSGQSGCDNQWPWSLACCWSGPGRLHFIGYYGLHVPWNNRFYIHAKIQTNCRELKPSRVVGCPVIPENVPRRKTFTPSRHSIWSARPIEKNWTYCNQQRNAAQGSSASSPLTDKKLTVIAEQLETSPWKNHSYVLTQLCVRTRSASCYGGFYSVLSKRSVQFKVSQCNVFLYDSRYASTFRIKL